MCTLTFFPFNNGAILTHNRDEHVLRKSAILPELYNRNGIKIIYPADGHAGGSWIGMSQKKSICLLNGAFVAHKSEPPYKISRGIVLLDAFLFDNLDLFRKNYPLLNIEPFTMVEFDHEAQSLRELRWTGKDIHFSIPEIKPTIWSSATLYGSHEQKQREKLFEDFLLNHDTYDSNNIWHFHNSGKTGNMETSLVMQKPNGVKTLSISQISTINGLEMNYEDKITSQSIQLALDL